MTVRQKLEAALKAHERAVPQLVREALEQLDRLEADASRWCGFRQAVVDQNERWLQTFGDAEHADEIPTADELDRAADLATK